MQTPKTRYADSHGVTIAYQVIGDAPQTLLMVPGFVSNLDENWDFPGNTAFYERIAAFARIVVFDRRGMGLSDRDAGLATPEVTVEDMLAVMSATETDKAWLMGVSEGGVSAALFAATHPHRTDALILFGSFARLVEAPDYPVGLDPERMIRFLGALEAGWGDPEALEYWAPSLAEDPHAREAWGRYVRSGSSPSGARRLLELYLSLDVREALPLISAPTLVLHTEKDRVSPARLGRYLAEQIPGASFVQLPYRDHIIGAHPHEIADEVELFLTGRRGAVPAERVLATVLFTDIVDSTKRAAEIGDGRWRELLDRHNAIVRAEIERHRGREVKTTGDGFLATFDGPARAVRAGQAIRDAVRPLGIEVRAGVHTGEVELLGDDIGGIAVHIASRVAATAGPSEILASSTVRDLTVGSGLAFEDRGRHALKGVPGDWQLLAVS